MNGKNFGDSFVSGSFRGGCLIQIGLIQVWGKNNRSKSIWLFHCRVITQGFGALKSPMRQEEGGGRVGLGELYWWRGNARKDQGMENGSAEVKGGERLYIYCIKRRKTKRGNPIFSRNSLSGS